MASKFAATDRPPIDSQGPFPHRASTIRWRDKPVSGGGDDAAVAEQRRQSRLSSVSSSSSMRAIPSPVLGVFMARNCSLRRSKRSESYRSNKSQPFSDEDKVQMEKARVSKDNSCFVPESEAQTKESGGNVSSAPVGIRPSLSVIDEMADENRRENSPSKSVTTSTDSSDAYESVCSEATSPQRVDHRSTASDENNENIVISL
ncbi:hypothetical protein AB6A40_009919 [Gnathostoma spinigerum]|uniref:Uncharacterized protein n=1 Tax=Gnathostoma spinigerum TaxID=75299 RepID=A0ABD6ETB1_9BILA